MQKIGTIENYYGGLFVKQEGKTVKTLKYYWGILDSKNVITPIKWEPIPYSLYVELYKFENYRKMFENNKLKKLKSQDNGNNGNN